MDDVARRKADLVVDTAKEHKAFDMVLLKVDHLSTIADYFFFCSCRSSRQAQAVAEHIREGVKKAGGFQPLGVEGESQGQWILIDYGDVICHIFHEPIREFYDLEGLWIEAETLDIGPDS